MRPYLISAAVLLSIAPLTCRRSFPASSHKAAGSKLSPLASPRIRNFSHRQKPITLLDADPQATIHYTLDGSAPTSRSPVYDPLQVLFIGGIYEGDKGLKAGYTIRAVAMRDGRTNSDIADFLYTVDRRDRTAYVSEEILLGVRMRIRDSDNDKMFLVKGSRKFALIDSGQGRGPLKQYLAQFAGGLPIEPIFTHSHGDHIGQSDEFIRDGVEHIGEGDRRATEQLLKSRGIPDDVIGKNLLSAHDGDRVDLGDRSLIIYAAPGHTPGSLVILDEQSGNLFTGDSFGSNSPIIPDALWMQFSRVSLDVYLAAIKNCRANFHGKVKYVMTGHNDRPLTGEKYLDNLEQAVQSLMDKGDSVLVPLLPSRWPRRHQEVGDRMLDPDWVAVNVDQAHYLLRARRQHRWPHPRRYRRREALARVHPEVKDYVAKLPHGATSLDVTVEPTSTRLASLTINGETANRSTRTACG